MRRDTLPSRSTCSLTNGSSNLSYAPMNAAASDNIPSAIVAELIARAIRERAAGRIGDVRVDRTLDDLVVQGQCQSFYGLQLAIEAARPYLQQAAAQRIRLALEVVADSARGHTARLFP